MEVQYGVLNECCIQMLSRYHISYPHTDRQCYASLIANDYMADVYRVICMRSWFSDGTFAPTKPGLSTPVPHAGQASTVLQYWVTACPKGNTDKK